MPYLGKQPARVPISSADIPDDSITAAKILDGAITIADIADDAVTEDKLANAINTAIAANTAKVTNATHSGEVTGSGALTITADAVTGAKIADNAVDSEHIAADSIDAEHYAAGSVDGTAIANDAVDSQHIAADSIDAEHYAAGSVDTTALGADAVTAAKIADDVINSEHYAAASIDNEHLADDAVGVAELSATGTASNSTFLRGDNAWAAAGSPSITDNGNAEAIRIDSSERVGINDTSPSEGRLSIHHSDVGNSGTSATLSVILDGSAGTNHVTPQYGIKVYGGGDNYSEPIYGIHSVLAQQNANTLYGIYSATSGNYATQYGSYAEITATHCATGGGVYGAYIKTTTGQTTGTARAITGLQIENANTAGSENNGLVIKTLTSVTSSDHHIMKCYNDGVLEWKMQPDGDSYNTNNTWGSISDSKLKENIVDANSQWDDIKALTIRNYNFKASTGHNTHTQIGIIAQEAELVSPGLVNETDDMADVDVEGRATPQKNGETTKSVKYSVLYMKAIKALQESMARIETLEAKVTALENA